MKTKLRTKLCLVTYLFLTTLLVQAQVTNVFDFNSANQLSAAFTQGGSSLLITQTTNTGIDGTGAVNVSGNTNEVFTTKQGYSISGEGAHYEFETYFKSEFNSGYGGIGFTSNPNATHNFYAAPSDGLGISVHGGGYIFTSGTTTNSGSWDGGDVLNSGSADDWYLAVLTIDLLANSYFDMTIKIYPANADGTLITPGTPTETKTWNVQNTAMANSEIIYSYFAFGGHRITNFDNYTINLEGGATIIEEGAPVVIGTSTHNSAANQIDMSGEVTDDRGSTVTERGFVYSTSVNPPTISDTKVVVGSGEGVFNDALGSLSANTIYYVRPFATNSIGTSYGDLSTIDTSVLSDNNIDSKAKIKVYPNPSTNFIRLSSETELKGYAIYTMLGREVLKGTTVNKNKIDIKSLSKGIYLLKLENLEVIKFIKE
ncbi:T9SS type A sorting domain-containing protein [Flavivirga eckloniae]|uniref:Secretion system C-terminal sorting domain-containing protein n=1 Tax=Flavivirga eckloniae TaxID=1803846 RepID=A0A2K9PLK3_9FLAO|nr:T9SS type A sorting domain-containing protein [Flavivirga eckloniae]AUP77457.1 hypothetical protein C1H87_01460 [Flavivirga eckloniae]